MIKAVIPKIKSSMRMACIYKMKKSCFITCEEGQGSKKDQKGPIKRDRSKGTDQKRVKKRKRIKKEEGSKGIKKEGGFTPFRIEDAQYATPSPLITAHKVGVLNEKRCKTSHRRCALFQILTGTASLEIENVPFSIFKGVINLNPHFSFYIINKKQCICNKNAI